MTLPRVHVRIPPALIDADISDGAFRLAVLLGSYANARRLCWPSMRTIAGRLGCHYDTARRRLHELEVAGLVQVTPRTDNGRQVPSLIRLGWSFTDVPDPVEKVGDNGPTVGGTPAPMRGTTPAPTRREELKPKELLQTIPRALVSRTC